MIEVHKSTKYIIYMQLNLRYFTAKILHIVPLNLHLLFSGCLKTQNGEIFLANKCLFFFYRLSRHTNTHTHNKLGIQQDFCFLPPGKLKSPNTLLFCFWSPTTAEENIEAVELLNALLILSCLRELRMRMVRQRRRAAKHKTS